MKLILTLWITVACVNGAWSALGPCGHKLTRNPNESADEDYFTLYIETLCAQQILTPKDLEPFFKALNQNKVINPIQHPDRHQRYSVHHDQFQKLIDSHSYELSQIQKWKIHFIEKIKIKFDQKEVSKKDTTLLPDYISKRGAMFYKINHPILGEAYKILKPKGVVSVKEDWDPVIWPTRPLNSNETYQNGFKLDPKNSNLVSAESPARKACLGLGPKIDLPTIDQYIQLVKYFDYEMIQNSVSLNEHEVKELIRIMKFPPWGSVWTSTVLPDDDHAFASQFGIGEHGISFMAIDRYRLAPVRCVERLW